MPLGRLRSIEMNQGVVTQSIKRSRRSVRLCLCKCNSSVYVCDTVMVASAVDLFHPASSYRCGYNLIRHELNWIHFPHQGLLCLYKRWMDTIFDIFCCKIGHTFLKHSCYLDECVFSCKKWCQMCIFCLTISEKSTVIKVWAPLAMVHTYFWH